MFSSIRGKVVLPILLVGFAFSVFGSYIIYHEIRDEYVAHTDTVLSLVTTSLGQSFSLSNDSLDWHRDTKKLRGYQGIKEIYIIDKASMKVVSAGDETMIGRSIAKIYDDDIQRMIQKAFRENSGEKLQVEQLLELRQTDIFDYTTRTGEPGKACSYVSLNVKNVYDSLYVVIRRTLGWFLVIIISITITVIALIYLFVMKPIGLISQVVKLQSQGDRDIRVHLKSKDEIKEFSESLNSMLDQLVDSEKKAARLAMVASNTRNAVLILGKDNRVSWTNEGFTKITGFENDEILGQSGEMIWGTAVNDYEVSQRIMENVMFKNPFREEILIQKKRGSYSWVDLEGTPYNNDIGEYAGMLLVANDIHQTKLYKNQLQRKTELLSESEDAAEIGSWDFDISKKKLSWSEQTYKIFGFPTNTEISYDNMAQSVVPDHRIELINAIETSSFDGTGWDMEVQIKRQDQRVIWVRYIGKAKLQDNKVVRLYGAIQNIDHVKRVQVEIERRDNAMRSLHEIATSKSLTDKEKLTEYLKQGCDLFGLHEAAILKLESDHGFIVEIGIDSNGAEYSGKYIQQDQSFASIAIEDPEPLLIHEVEDTEYMVHLEYIQEETESFLGIPLYIKNKLYGALTFRSEYPRHAYKEWEVEMLKLLARRIQTLKTESQNLSDLASLAKRLEIATDAALIGVWDWNIITDELIWDNSMYKLYGIDAREVKINELNKVWEETVHPEDIKSVQNAVAQSVQTHNDLMAEFRIHWKDGSIRHLRSKARIEKDKQGTATNLIGVSWDVTDEKNLKHFLIETKERAEKASKAKSDFLKSISKELTTPVASILNTARELSQLDLNDKQKELMNVLAVSCNNLNYLINDALDFAKIESGARKLAKVPFNISDAIEESLALKSGDAIGKGLYLGYSTDSYLPNIVHGDVDKLRQILHNLIGNAIKFTDEGYIFIRAFKEEETTRNIKVLFTVQDTGVGLTKSMKAQLFNGEVRNETQSAGAGLGLAICERLVSALGGTISVESDTSLGSSFVFTADFEKDPNSISEMAILPAVEHREALIIGEPKIARSSISILLDRAKIPNSTMDTNSFQSNTLEIEQKINTLLILGSDTKTLAKARKWLKAKSSENHPKQIIVLCSKRQELRLSSKKHLTILNTPLRRKALYNIIEKKPSLPHPEVQSKPIISSKTPFNILIVDDNNMNLLLSQTIIKKRGHNVKTVMTGKDALILLERESFDIIYMDLYMPEMNGFDAAKGIRSLTQNRDIPWIVGLTASLESIDRDKALEAGMNDFIEKPLNAENFTNSFQGYLSSLEK